MARSIRVSVLTLRHQVVLEISPHLATQSLSMLLKELTRDEREVVKPAILMLLLLLVLPDFVIQLFLIVKEHEFVLEHFRAAHLCFFVDFIVIRHLVQILFVLLDLHVPDVLLFGQVLAHLAQMVGKDLLVGHLIPEVDFLSETDQVGGSLVWASETFRALRVSGSVKACL